MEDKNLSTSSVQKLSEIMCNIVVYVEVRTQEDNRSEGIKKVISSLGAKVKNRLTKNITHVIFKDGLISTYKKAKQMNIPLVSILWVEACRKNFKLMDPTQYPISNIDRYEYPEIYEKFKRIKSMQPDAVDGRQRTKNLKYSQKNNVKNGESSFESRMIIPKIPRTPKDNLNNILSEFQDKIMSTPDNDDSFIFHSKILQKIQNSPFTPKTSKVQKPLEKIMAESCTINDKNNNSKKEIRVIRESARDKKPNINYINDKFINQRESTEKKKSRRRTIASTSNPTKLNGTKDLSSYFTPVRENNQKELELITSTAENPQNPTQEIQKGQDCNNISSESSNVSSTEYSKENMITDLATPTSRPNNEVNRRTLYTPQNMDLSSILDSAKILPKNRRRTLFDISLDIIDKSLKNINEQSRINKTNNEQQTIIDQTNNNIDNEIPKLNCTLVNLDNTTPTIKKRKLYMPDQFNLTPVAEYNKNLLTSSAKRSKNTEKPDLFRSVGKKRKTISTMDPIFTKSRLSSFDFDNLFNKQSPQPTKINAKKQISSKIIVCTNMHKEQIEFIKNAVKTLGGFEIEETVTERTTHVISPECRRTINIIKGIIRGLWVLKYEWVIDSFNKGEWLHEEFYELREFSRSIQICRSERQAYGPDYRMELLAGLSSIYVSNKCKIPIDSLKDIIKLCSGVLVNDPQKSKYVIGDYYQNKICLQPQWILDSITNNKIMNYFKYSIVPQN